MKRIGLMIVVLALMAAACASESGNTAADEVSETPSSQADAEQDQAVETSSTVAVDNEVVDSEPAPTTTAAPEATAAPTTAAVAPPLSLEPDCAAVGRVGIGVQSGTLVSGGNEYSYQWTVPSTYSGEPIPVVLDFHGIGSNGPQQALFSGWAAKAEREGFLAVQPTGLMLPGDERASWELPQFETDARDDVQMVLDLLDLVAASICVDPARVYSTGMSNGGLFTAELVCDLSEHIAAAASVAGVTHHESCAPTRAVPFIAFHGTDDDVVPFDGSGVSTLSGADDGGEFFEQVMPEEFAEFASDFSCASSVDNAVTAEVTLTSYSGCEDDVELGFYTIVGAGHTWPGSSVSAAISSLGVTNTDISATDLAWEFFTRHSLTNE